ncbi:hypothetical protein PTSG_02393 [Salpingoeca rosetta]|uniref:Large ribosomal subunit protein uL4m n=1 Tax=Salpingoeca rosetta (strain ATCC 50818 / BSB-021) TaxID=946362 RepID=F2U227_SALR5|nr:uncharacterized protein PTSG_02393 [Salpingoeca rosetta]EGD81679.1 hypothetical protein PTSG_02393 [Salpingoeca rosetta]|eukprot:XP_004996883.1 hypothetical protein PTSG_02393 [Salpingoeca rosetta]
MVSTRVSSPLGGPLPKKPQPTTPLQAWVTSLPAAYRVGMMELDPTVFGEDLRKDILQRVVVFQRASWRAGTAKTKTRSEVRGGGKKPWQQKGTGRARASSIRSPLFRGGGTVHGPTPKDWSIKLPKKVQRMGVRVALSAKLAQNDLLIVDSLNLPSSNEEDLLEALFSNSLPPNLSAAAEGLDDVTVMPQRDINVYDMLNHPTLIMSMDAVREVEQWLSTWRHGSPEDLTSFLEADDQQQDQQ